MQPPSQPPVEPRYTTSYSFTQQVAAPVSPTPPLGMPSSLEDMRAQLLHTMALQRGAAQPAGSQTAQPLSRLNPAAAAFTPYSYGDARLAQGSSAPQQSMRVSLDESSEQRAVYNTKRDPRRK